MIKINLLPQRDVKRRRRVSGGGGPSGPGGNVLALFGLVLIMEIAGLMYWFMQTEDATSEGTDLSGLQAEKGDLETVDRELKELETLETEIGRQRVVFEELQDNKVGPVNLLMFVAYVVRRVDAGMDEDQYRVLSDLWAPEGRPTTTSIGPASEQDWNPDRVWIERIAEADGAMTIEGGAKDHEDVMTFLRRLKTGIYFESIDLVEQKVGKNSPLGQPYVTFKLRCEVNYNPKEYPAL